MGAFKEQAVETLNKRYEAYRNLRLTWPLRPYTDWEIIYGGDTELFEATLKREFDPENTCDDISEYLWQRNMEAQRERI